MLLLLLLLQLLLTVIVRKQKLRVALEDKNSREAQRVEAVIEELRKLSIVVVAPKVTVKLPPAAAVECAARLPRQQLQEEIEREILPPFVRIFGAGVAPGGLGEGGAGGRNSWLEKQCALLQPEVERKLQPFYGRGGGVAGGTIGSGD